MDILRQEEERFFTTIEHGMAILESDLAEMAKSGANTFNGETAFKLHDTYGFPLDLTADVCRERGVTVDEAGFNAAMGRQRDQARAAGKFKMAAGLEFNGAATQFHGYDQLVQEGAAVVALYVDGAPVDRVGAGSDAVIVLDQTPFYAESGGQVGDTGELRNATTRVIVEDTIKVQAAVFGHQAHVAEGEVRLGDLFTASGRAAPQPHGGDNERHPPYGQGPARGAGTHVQQKGSLVNAERTRFDFAHNAPMSDADIREVEARVNAEILANAATLARVLPIDEAQKTGAMMLFGEKVLLRGACARHRQQPRAVWWHRCAAHR